MKLLQEDSIVVNKAAVERGLGRVTQMVVRSVALSGGKDVETFGYPPLDVRGRQLGCNYETVRAGCGLPTPGTRIEPNDCLVGKMARIVPETSKNSRMCRSVVYEGPPGVIDSVAVTKDLHGNRVCVVKIRVTYNLLEGDKLSSRYGSYIELPEIVTQPILPYIAPPLVFQKNGPFPPFSSNKYTPEMVRFFSRLDSFAGQKGTIGRIVPQENMPFSPRTGMVPDLLIVSLHVNPV